jgi:hypothetical protein
VVAQLHTYLESLRQPGPQVPLQPQIAHPRPILEPVQAAQPAHAAVG